MTARISPAIVLLACVGAACASSETDVAADSTPAPTPAVTASAAPTCWVRGGTPADAAARPSPLAEVRFTLGGQEALLELCRVQHQLSRNPEEREIVRLLGKRQDVLALRAEVSLGRRTCAAIAALIHDGYAPKELPQPQVCFAFGLLNTNPLLSSAVS